MTSDLLLLLTQVLVSMFLLLGFPFSITVHWLEIVLQDQVQQDLLVVSSKVIIHSMLMFLFRFIQFEYAFECLVSDVMWSQVLALNVWARTVSLLCCIFMLIPPIDGQMSKLRVSFLISYHLILADLAIRGSGKTGNLEHVTAADTAELLKSLTLGPGS